MLSGYYKGGPVTKEARNQAPQKGEFAGGFMLGDQIYPADTEAPKAYDKFKTPYFDTISFTNLTATGTNCYTGFIIGTPEKPFINITLKNIKIDAKEGLKIRNAEVTLDKITIETQTGQ